MKIKLLGDPHLGRIFTHGVPLHNRGKREIMMWNQFTEHVATSKKYDMHICMGDLFDKSVVPYNVIRRAAEVYINAAEYCTDTTFVVLKGNHDWMRDLEMPSAFDIFAKIVAPYKNIICVSLPRVINGIAFFPWHPTMTSKEMVARVTKEIFDNKCTVAYGHWDLESFGGSDLNLVPTNELKSVGITEIFNGHIHKAQELVRDDIKISVVGSMQPYAHGEESDESLYVTRKLGDLGDPDQYRNRYLRVVLSRGESLDVDVDCLQLTIKREGETESDTPAITLGEFDIEKLFLEAFAKGEVSKETTEKLHALFQSRRLTAGT
jgi:DNA repair exonuclease SbcCD nuclease subunit